MIGASSPRFLVSLPIEWSEEETAFDQEFERVQAQLNALIQERFVGRLVAAWPPQCEQVRFYWGTNQNGVSVVRCDVCYPPAFSPARPEPLMPSPEYRRQYQADMKLKQETYVREHVAPFQEQLNRATQEEGVTIGMMNQLLGMHPSKNADFSPWFSSPEALLARLRDGISQGKVSHFRREALLEGHLPAPAKPYLGPRF